MCVEKGKHVCVCVCMSVCECVCMCPTLTGRSVCLSVLGSEWMKSKKGDVDASVDP